MIAVYLHTQTPAGHIFGVAADLGERQNGTGLEKEWDLLQWYVDLDALLAGVLACVPAGNGFSITPAIGVWPLLFVVLMLFVNAKPLVLI